MRKIALNGVWAGFVAVVCSWSADHVLAEGPGVPGQTTMSGDYVSHAVTNLPGYYRSGLVGAANNTPLDNPITNAGAQLGRALFYDARLSHNNGTSCASCHVQENGFNDPNQFSEGFAGELTARRSMGLTNAMFYARGRFFWDERAASLEEQVLAPIQDPVEMGSNLADVTAELAATEFYPVLFERAFGDSQITSDRMARAMSQFIRSMVSYESKFDEALAAAQLSDVLTEQELQGHAIFQGRCASCHREEAQIAAQPENIGLDAVTIDEGAGNGRFKAPSLRNIAVREGYMADGRFGTLEEVIEFYASGAQPNPALNRRRIPIGGFGFSADEQAALVAFLETLTDETFLSSELFSDPFAALAGDYDGDGFVDGDDLAVWQSMYGMTALTTDELLFADGNLDGAVDAIDYAIWRENLGARWDDLFGTLVAIPEPTGAALVAMLLAGALARRSPRRSPNLRA